MADSRATTRRTVATVVGIVALILVFVWRSMAQDDEPHAVDDEETSAARTVDSGKKLPRDSGRQMLAADKASVSGTIRANDGTPIAGATVCAKAEGRELLGAGDKLPKCSTSEHDGHYRLDGLWPVSTQIHAGAAQFIPARWSEQVDGRERYEMRLREGEERRAIDIVLERGGVPVRGVVNDIGGGVIDGAFVTANTGRWVEGAFVVARTDGEGRFELWTKSGEVALTAQAEGYAPASTDAMAPTELATIFLTPESVIEGTVVHVETGVPMAGVTVRATSGFAFGDFEMFSGNDAITDSEGRFRIASLTPGIYDLVARSDELYGEGVEQLHIGLGQSVEDVVVEVHPAFAVVGKIVIAETKAPCTEGRVTLERDGKRVEGAVDENGEVLVRALFPGTYRVVVGCDRYVPEREYEPIVITDANRVDLEWLVHTGLAIRGVVVDANSAPVAGVGVFGSPRAVPGDPRAQVTSSWAMKTDEQGNFELEGLLPGTYELEMLGGDTHVAMEPVVVALESADVEGVRLVVPATGRLVGLVRDDSGAVVPGVTVWVSSLTHSMGMRNRTTTADDGSFEFERLGVGSVRVRASVRGAGTTDDDLQGEVVEIVANDEARIELTVEGRTLGIRGRVVDQSGAPVSDAFLEATRMSDSAAAGPGTQTSARWGWNRRPVLSEQDGSFEIGELSEGEYIVRAYREGGGEGLVEHVAAGSTGVEVKIAGTGEIAGKVAFVDGGSPERFTVVAADRAQGLQRSDEFFRTEGSFSIRELAPGNYQIHVTAAEGSASTEVALAAGQSIDDLALELVGKITVQGRLVDAETREPVAGMEVWISSAGGGGFNPGAAAQDHVSDANGRFRVEGVPVGKVRVRIRSRGFGSTDTGYAMTRLDMTLPSDPAAQDVGEIELMRSRVGDGEKPGELGYTLARLPPDIEPEDRYYEVAVIRPGGPADGTGLAIGDRIVKVDGRAVGGTDNNYGTLTGAPPGTSIVLGIEGGKQVTIVLGQPVQ